MSDPLRAALERLVKADARAESGEIGADQEWDEAMEQARASLAAGAKPDLDARAIARTHDILRKRWMAGDDGAQAPMRALAEYARLAASKEEACPVCGSTTNDHDATPHDAASKEERP
jgi:hypothetical protein